MDALFHVKQALRVGPEVFFFVFPRLFDCTTKSLVFGSGVTLTASADQVPGHLDFGVGLKSKAKGSPSRSKREAGCRGGGCPGVVPGGC